MSLTHLDEKGKVKMVDVSEKQTTTRTAVSRGSIAFSKQVAESLRKQPNTSKGNIFECARVAGIMAAKRTSELIPMCHPLVISSVKLEFDWLGDSVWVECSVKCEGKTGVEMEALHGTSVALLTLYDMTKALGKESVISDIHLVSKTGGKSGIWHKEKEKSTT
ncbi:MAG: cyclic pyranopterin monophosphate synthase MoaC [Acidobacteria bacterium]|nr:MAG: cyclic pyranopterin monophosphate synthase MoaC [Acidobacteriota bacterium]